MRGVKLILSSKAAFEAFGGFNDQHLIVIMSRALSASFCRCSQSGRVLGCCVVHVFRILLSGNHNVQASLFYGSLVEVLHFSLLAL